MEKITKEQREYIIKLIQEGKDLPEEFKYFLFPTKQKEYELVYAGKIRKEDLLANEDGVFPVPLQVDKVFNGERESWNDGWKNMIVFGDNLQFLKTVYENKDPLIKDKVKGKVKLIYIDPPFGTGDEYDGNKGQNAYSAKRKGADYVEFIRRRLLIAYEILADDGLIFVRQGYNFGHYIKIVLDEVFGKNNFINEIIVNRGKQRLGGTRKYSTATDSVYLYSKMPNYQFAPFKRPRYESEAKGTNMLMKGERNPAERTFYDPDGNKVTLLPPPGMHWKFVQSKIDEMYKKGVIYLAQSRDRFSSGIRKIENGVEIPVDYSPSFKFDEDKTVDSNWTDISGYSQETGYPTENSEELLKRVILTGTKKGDLVLDFFGGSGTTAVVAEKLGRRWLVVDIGKFAYYTMQKRILQIENSKDLEDPKKKYGKKARSFITARLGIYDLKQALDLEWKQYLTFVSELFEFEIKEFEIAGLKFEGKKGEYPVKVFNYIKFKDASVDENYLQNIQNTIGDRISGRVYVVAPANYVDFIQDYYQIGNIRYYFLKIPYQVIKELHKIPFKKLRQPQSKKNINGLEEIIGFHFIRQPEVKSELKVEKDKIKLIIKEFRSQYYKDEEGKILNNFETLSTVFIDKNYNGKYFEMDEVYFADELLPRRSKKKEEDNIREKLKEIKDNALILEMNKKEAGNKIMIVYTDIYGNDFTEVLDIKEM
ncbi:site-specific DNA-methyltransferase [Thermoanaerobacterium butyriciformans]|uniref:Site-specific DNA-methyltransferase (Adenine-specific)/adenine-specific DNA-methyltransferase n=1 Tax=Thermoanaerobacterium butyriciformans TaxID=1702242 RepID=A0ABS4NAN8_9THEO|nr:site-specific DNA-methyltransferase [Thermoanaerobacterium butyriciformans]MBP2070731.1 site-specific DNA-methyltransferase (adenine-specific)/adenine-specific DNA-methyltransferase [Thermoanaerobacterium butyriciformans]